MNRSAAFDRNYVPISYIYQINLTRFKIHPFRRFLEGAGEREGLVCFLVTVFRCYCWCWCCCCCFCCGEIERECARACERERSEGRSPSPMCACWTRADACIPFVTCLSTPWPIFAGGREPVLRRGRTLAPTLVH